MDYATARPSIDTGDLIAVRRRSGPLAIATRLVTGSPYTHTGIALRWNDQLLIAQLNGAGSGFAPLSQEVEFGFDVFDCPVDRVKVEAAMLDTLAERMGYDVLDLVRIFAYIRLGVPLPPESGGYICSSLSALIYMAAGWSAPGLPSIPWPAAIVDAIGSPPKLEVRP